MYKEKVSRLFIDKKIDSIERTQIPIILDAKQRVIAIGPSLRVRIVRGQSIALSFSFG
jgi:hypothetical protein